MCFQQWVDLLMMIATFLVVIVALFGERFWEWIRRPRIRLYFYTRYPFIKEVDDPLPTGHKRKRKWIRIYVENKGKSVANSCECWLEELKYFDSKEYRDCIPFDPIVLHWVGYPIPENAQYTKEWVTNDIASESKTLVDIGYIVEHSLDLNLLSSIQIIRGVRYQWLAGKYRFKIVVYGKNIKPEIRTIDIDTNDYNNFVVPPNYP